MTLLTKYHGRVDCVAKAGKKISSRKSSKIDLINLVDVNLAEGKNLDVVTEIKLSQSFLELKKDPDLNKFLWLMAEISEKLSFQNSDNDGIIFKKLNDYLKAVNSLYKYKLLEEDSDEKIYKMEIITSYYILKILKDLGFEINFENYQDSGIKILPKDKRYLSVDLGFNNIQQSKILITDNVYKLLKFMYNNGEDKLFNIKLSKEELSTVWNIVIMWIEQLIQKKLGSLYLF